MQKIKRVYSEANCKVEYAEAQGRAGGTKIAHKPLISSWDFVMCPGGGSFSCYSMDNFLLRNFSFINENLDLLFQAGVDQFLWFQHAFDNKLN